MRTTKSVNAVRQDAAAASAQSGHQGIEGLLPDEEETYESYRVICPDCRQAIAMLSLEEKLPEHAMCASKWDPFGLTVCQGAGRPVREATPADGTARERGVGELLTLPEGLDWRTQPFSHVGGPGSRPMPVIGQNRR
ncbi:hypothetical protein [Streptomyces axinellae]|uniref:Uncharacterized protein n=1 Tax=Streptomyces axinellae TaxID=552788 RepID=A0ABP6C1Z6_9ACTN